MCRQIELQIQIHMLVIEYLEHSFEWSLCIFCLRNKIVTAIDVYILWNIE